MTDRDTRQRPTVRLEVVVAQDSIWTSFQKATTSVTTGGLLSRVTAKTTQTPSPYTYDGGTRHVALWLPPFERSNVHLVGGHNLGSQSVVPQLFTIILMPSSNFWIYRSVQTSPLPDHDQHWIPVILQWSKQTASSVQTMI
jgi:hypothetical protein